MAGRLRQSWAAFCFWCTMLITPEHRQVLDRLWASEPEFRSRLLDIQKRHGLPVQGGIARGSSRGDILHDRPELLENTLRWENEICWPHELGHLAHDYGLHLVAGCYDFLREAAFFGWYNPPIPKKLPGHARGKIDWQPLIEYAERYPLISEKEIAAMVKRPYGVIRQKLSGVRRGMG